MTHSVPNLHEAQTVIVGVDTHKHMHVAVAIDIGSAIRLMDEHCCGALPVVDQGDRVVGIVTDRDVALALGAADVEPSEMHIHRVMTTPARTCRVTDTVHQALHTMQETRICRLPVVNDADRLVGLISIADIVLAAQNVRAGVGRVSYEQAMAALHDICSRSAQGAMPL